ncbi:MAG: primosomal protein N' [Alphaproteobacteria bacterium]|nr:primosomal protein N' [Alphaproteobacteria bacterium]
MYECEAGVALGDIRFCVLEEALPRVPRPCSSRTSHLFVACRALVRRVSCVHNPIASSPSRPLPLHAMAPQPSYIIEVLVARPVGKTYSYRHHLPIAAGTVVTVPFNQRTVQGVVWRDATLIEPDAQEKHHAPNALTAQNRPRHAKSPASKQAGSKQQSDSRQPALFGDQEQESATPPPPSPLPPSVAKLKRIEQHGDLVALPATMRDFLTKVAEYTLTPLGSVLNLTPLDPKITYLRTSVRPYLRYLPPDSVPSAPADSARKSTGEFAEKEDQQSAVCGQAAEDTLDSGEDSLAKPPRRISSKGQVVLDFLGDFPRQWVSQDFVMESVDVSRAVIETLVKNGVIQSEKRTTPTDTAHPTTNNGPDARVDYVLNEAQQEVTDAIHQKIAQVPDSAFLIHGVTGSGKTEVYCTILQRLLASDSKNQVLVMLPEISLSEHLATRIGERCGVEPLQWHSALTITQRRKTWRAIASGRGRLVVSPRSGLFLPFRKLSGIVIDEEHDPSFKQEETVLYNARDMAIYRAKIEGIPVMLASATPSAESYYKAMETPRLHYLRLAKRYSAAEKPNIQLASPPTEGEAGQFIGPAILETFTEALKNKQQCMLFLNRRGFAPLYVCNSCKAARSCLHCDAPLVYHRYTDSLHCHLCNTQYNPREPCPACNSPAGYSYRGASIERIEQEVHAHWGDINPTVEVVSSDYQDGDHGWAEKFQAGAIDILVGTQMVVKGFDFDNLTAVGVIDAEMGLARADFRAQERVYQLLAQVAGRPGRRHRQGTVILQAHNLDDPVLQAIASGDADGFYAAELARRAKHSMPPFGHLASLLVQGENHSDVQDLCDAIKQTMPQPPPHIRVLGPSIAETQRIARKWRFRFLVISKEGKRPHPFLRAWQARIGHLKNPARIRCQFDIDPYRMD